jgi:hypothetical protein
MSNSFSGNFYHFTDINFFFDSINFEDTTLNLLSKEFLCDLTNLTLIKNDSLKILNFFPGFETHDMLACLEI